MATLLDTEPNPQRIAGTYSADRKPFIPPHVEDAHRRQQTQYLNPYSAEAIDCANIIRTWEHSLNVQRQFDADIGKRYAGCEFDSYQCQIPKQEKVLQSLREYAENAAERIAEGRNVILYGPKGTGKDHLLVALARAVFYRTQTPTTWHNGVDLRAEFHRRLLNAKDYDDGFTHPEARVPILYISDPLPTTGALSESQQQSLFQLIDKRYREMRPTWISCNVADPKDAADKMGSQTIDRLKEYALVLHCNWESFRKGAS